MGLLRGMMLGSNSYSLNGLLESMNFPAREILVILSKRVCRRRRTFFGGDAEKMQAESKSFLCPRTKLTSKQVIVSCSTFSSQACSHYFFCSSLWVKKVS